MGITRQFRVITLYSFFFPPSPHRCHFTRTAPNFLPDQTIPYPHPCSDTFRPPLAEIFSGHQLDSTYEQKEQSNIPPNSPKIQCSPDPSISIPVKPHPELPSLAEIYRTSFRDRSRLVVEFSFQCNPKCCAMTIPCYDMRGSGWYIYGVFEGPAEGDKQVRLLRWGCADGYQ